MRLPAVIAVLALVGCSGVEQVPPPDAGSRTPKIGDSCGPLGQWSGDGTCGDAPGVVLWCQAGRLSPFACRGPLGCQQSSGNAVFCDVSLDLTSDPCPTAWEGRGACSPDAGTFAKCSNGQFIVYGCSGGCRTDGGSITCQP